MRQQWIRAAIFVAFGLGVVATAVVPGVLAEDKKVSNKEIMAANHKGKESLFGKVKDAIKGGKWDDAAASAKTLADNGAALVKNSARGDKDSWQSLSKKYADNTKALADAAGKKDADAAKTAIGAIGGSCKECHDGHRGKK